MKSSIVLKKGREIRQVIMDLQKIVNQYYLEEQNKVKSEEYLSKKECLAKANYHKTYIKKAETALLRLNSGKFAVSRMLDEAHSCIGLIRLWTYDLSEYQDLIYRYNQNKILNNF